jgi:hypothetical protein
MVPALVALASVAAQTCHKARSPPGNMVMWRGMARLTDIVLGVDLAKPIVGNRKPAKAALLRQ